MTHEEACHAVEVEKKAVTEALAAKGIRIKVDCPGYYPPMWKVEVDGKMLVERGDHCWGSWELDMFKETPE